MSTAVNQERWFVKHWRPAAAWIYLSICVFDFVIMPVYHLRSQTDLNRIVEISTQLRPEDRLSAIVTLSKKTAWEPLTIAGSGILHLSFGAILGVAAWTRGRVQEQMVRNQPTRPSYDSPYDGADATPDSPTSSDGNPAPRPPRRSTRIDTNSY